MGIRHLFQKQSPTVNEASVKQYISNIKRTVFPYSQTFTVWHELIPLPHYQVSLHKLCHWVLMMPKWSNSFKLFQSSTFFTHIHVGFPAEFGLGAGARASPPGAAGDITSSTRPLLRSQSFHNAPGKWPLLSSVTLLYSCEWEWKLAAL